MTLNGRFKYSRTIFSDLEKIGLLGACSTLRLYGHTDLFLTYIRPFSLTLLTYVSVESHYGREKVRANVGRTYSRNGE